VLDLDGSRRHERGGGDAGGGLRAERAESRRYQPAAAGRTRRPGDRADAHADGGGAGRGPTGPAAGAGGQADVREQQLLREQQRTDGHQERQRLARRAQLGAEDRAALAGAQVAAHRRRRAVAQPLGDLAELEAHVLTGELARLGGLGERDARAHEQRLHARDRRLHRLGDLLVGERVDLAQQQRGALGLRQLLHVRDQLAELLALVDLVGRRRAVLGEVDVHRVDAQRLDAAQVVEAAVARDAIEPRARVDRPLVGEDRVEGGGEDLLEDVLGVLARAEHVAAEGEQA
jgi:hypothetical protein